MAYRLELRVAEGSAYAWYSHVGSYSHETLRVHATPHASSYSSLAETGAALVRDRSRVRARTRGLGLELGLGLGLGLGVELGWGLGPPVLHLAAHWS